MGNPFRAASNQGSTILEAIHYPELYRFQTDIDGLEASCISYIEHSGGWDVNHIEVSSSFRHRGIVELLVDALMGYAETYHTPLTTGCNYTARFIG